MVSAGGARRIGCHREESPCFNMCFHSISAHGAAGGRAGRGSTARYVPCRVVRAPKAAAKRGCGYAVRVEGRDGARSAALLREAGQRFSGVFRLLPDGTAEEAAL